ncbi:basic amino acid ABC transporter substrate-binding protein [Chitinivorax sp. B]|uniref:basic amino acid ABC transporter substrate-binding protein n=1 Tax=Chitinivorax sp. B TaxID=2502235 RepID=UPI0010FA6293|nr:basic amino acid ABC transporter substrate-binding protein [Chitinivorax sp. B]
MKQIKNGLLSALLLSVALMGCGKKEEPAADTATVQSTTPAATPEQTPASTNKNELVVATEAQFEPFEFRNEQKELVGFDIDLVKAIAAKQGMTVKFEDMPFESTFTAVRDGKVDMVAAAVTITDDRRQTLDFSEPYFQGGLAIATNNTGVNSLDSLKKVKTGVQEATTGEKLLTKLAGGASPNIVGFKDNDKAFEALLKGDVKAVLADNWVVSKFVATHADKQLRMVTDPAIPVEPSGFVFKQGNAELSTKINAGLNAVKDDGTYSKLYQQYFGQVPPTK